MTKQCTKCKEIKELNLFIKKNDIASGVGSICKTCVNKRCNAWNDRHRDKINARSRELYKNDNGTKSKNCQLKHMYGITLDQYNQMLADQQDKCAICFRKRSKSRRLAVDHCHKTGKVRGLLCTRCNLAFGYVNENLDTILGMVDYARKYFEHSKVESKRLKPYQAIF